MAAASISYAGVSLPLATTQFEDVLGKIAPQHRWGHFQHEVPDADLLGLPLPQVVQPPSNFKLPTLWWPTGASQYARAYLVVNESKLTTIRAALVSASGSANAGYVASTLVLSNDDGTSLTTSMYLIAAQPLLGHESNADRLFLLTLADERFLWWQKPGGLSGTLTSWTGIASAIGTALGTTVTIQGSLTGYHSPSTRWTSMTWQPIPLLLDALAHSIGRRVVRKLDGTILLQDADSAKTASDAEKALNASGTYRRQGGGSRVTVDVQKVVPATVRVRGASTNRDVTLSSLAISDYGTTTGRAGFTANYLVDASSLSLAQGQLLATEWYKWRLLGDEYDFARFCNVTPNASWGSIEWTLSDDEHATRWYPLPAEAGYSNGSDVSSASLQTINSDSTQDVPATTKITASLTTGVRFDKSGTTQTLSNIDASILQTGVVNTTNQGFKGRKSSYSATGVSGGGWEAYGSGGADAYVEGLKMGLSAGAGTFTIPYPTFAYISLYCGGGFGSGPFDYTFNSTGLLRFDTAAYSATGTTSTAFLTYNAPTPLIAGTIQFPALSGGSVFAVGPPSIGGTYSGSSPQNRFAVTRLSFSGPPAQYQGIDYLFSAGVYPYTVGGIVVGYTTSVPASSSSPPTVPPVSPTSPPTLPPVSPTPPPTSPPIGSGKEVFETGNTKTFSSSKVSLGTGGFGELLPSSQPIAPSGGTGVGSAPSIQFPRPSVVTADTFKGGTAHLQSITLVSPNGTKYDLVVSDMGSISTSLSTA